MKTISLFLVVCLLAVTTQSMAQQMPFSSQYYTNMFVVNPGFTGSSEYAKAFLSHRSQFIGLEGAPQTSYISVDGRTTGGKVGLGLSAYTDATDILSKTSVMANYSYLLTINSDHQLRFGLALGVQNNRIDYDKARVVDETDPILFSSQRNQTVFNADFGIVYDWKKLQVGVAIPQLLTHTPTFNTNAGDNLMYSTSRHLRMSAKYDFTINESKGITAYPLVLVRAVSGAPVQFDLTGVVDLKRLGWFGITYHNNSAIAFSAGVRYKSFSIGYAYDIALGNTNLYSKRSSEFMLSYEFGEKLREQKVWNESMASRVTKLEEENKMQQQELENIKNQQAEQEKSLAEIKALSETHTIDIDSIKTDVTELQVSIEKAPFSNLNGPLDADGFKTGKVNDYTIDQDLNATKGYYVVVGAFGIKENAYKQKATCLEQGYTFVEVLLNKEKGLREVFVFFSLDKQTAVIEKQKYVKDYEKVWILKLD